MQHVLDYITLSESIKYRSVCKVWLEHINNRLMIACHPICFMSARLIQAMIRAYPEKINEYFLICLVGNYRTVFTFPPVNIDNYLLHAIRDNNTAILIRLLKSGQAFDMESLIDYAQSMNILRVLESHTVEGVLKNKLLVKIHKYNKNKYCFLLILYILGTVLTLMGGIIFLGILGGYVGVIWYAISRR